MFFLHLITSAFTHLRYESLFSSGDVFPFYTSLSTWSISSFITSAISISSSSLGFSSKWYNSLWKIFNVYNSLISSYNPFRSLHSHCLFYSYHQLLFSFLQTLSLIKWFPKISPVFSYVLTYFIPYNCVHFYVFSSLNSTICSYCETTLKIVR